MAKLGSDKHPAVVHVQTQERAEEILSVCTSNGWVVIIGLEPDQLEDVSDVEKLLHPPAPTGIEAKVGRNDPCPCGGGLKYKKCCGSR